ncbi:MAG: hypothetical protein U1D55_01940 [Phycisphaerae bacterium]
MKLPSVNDPQRYRGLFAIDFGDSSALGYTAQEVATLLESERFHNAKVYRIHRVTPDGKMELQGVSSERFGLEAGMFFYRADRDAAREDFAELSRLAETTPPPVRAFLHLADRGQASGPQRYVTALIYPSESDEEIASWLSAAGFAGGDTAEGGVSHVANYFGEERLVLDRIQLWSQTAIPFRSRDELLAGLRHAVQR